MFEEEKKEVVKNGRPWEVCANKSSHEAIKSLKEEFEKEDERYDFKVKRRHDSEAELYVLKRRLKQEYLEEASNGKKKKSKKGRVKTED